MLPLLVGAVKRNFYKLVLLKPVFNWNCKSYPEACCSSELWQLSKSLPKSEVQVSMKLQQISFDSLTFYTWSEIHKLIQF